MLIINYRNSPVYVQKMIDRIFRLFRHFYKVYVNDIVIFFILFKKHFNYFIQIFRIFDNMNIYLIFVKIFLGYFLIQLLN